MRYYILHSHIEFETTILSTRNSREQILYGSIERIFQYKVTIDFEYKIRLF